MTTSTTPARGNWKTLSVGYDEALARVTDALKAEGFGIITEIDAQATFKAKLDVDFRRYKILGACNPGFAHKALTADAQMGVLLPCNVVVYENDDKKAVVGAIDPIQTLGVASSDPKLAELASEVASRLERAMAAVAG